VLWALGQPAAAIGLGGAFLLGLVLRTCGQVLCARAVGARAAFAARDQVDPVGAVAVVLRGVVAPSLAEQVVLSVVVGLVCFGLVALVPVPPTDGFRLLRLASFLLLLVVPVAGSPPLLVALDLVGTPLVRAWS
jgi:hypothetical protein